MTYTVTRDGGVGSARTAVVRRREADCIDCIVFAVILYPCLTWLAEATRLGHGVGRVVLCIEFVVIQVWYKMVRIPMYGMLWLLKKKLRLF